MIIHKVYKKLIRFKDITESYFSGSKYGIRAGYLHKKETEHFDDTSNKDEWQKEVYQIALDAFNVNSYKTLLDIGCGSAYKLRSIFKDKKYTGVEIGATLEYLKANFPSDHWCSIDECKGKKYDIVILSDVIEHVPNPNLFLQNIITEIEFKKIIISTPDRLLLGGLDLGPPINPTHFREWNLAEFNAFISSLLVVEKQFISNYDQATQVIIASPKS